jgi:hypothetical protein
MLLAEYPADLPTVEAVAELLQAQERESEIPADELLVEASPLVPGETYRCDFHLPLAAPSCAALARLIARRHRRARCTAAGAGCLGFSVILQCERPFDHQTIRRLLDLHSLEEDLQRSFEHTEELADRFRAAAMNALALLKNPLGKRRRVGGRGWAGRRLFHWIRCVDPQFPILRQALDEVMFEVADVESIRACLGRLLDRPIRIRRLRKPSPLAGTWTVRERAELPTLTQPGSPFLTSEPGCITASPPDLIHRDWLLTPERAAVHLASRTAVIADVHLGYDAARRAAGEAVPDRGWRGVRRRLESLLARHEVERIVVAGDLVESVRCVDEARQLGSWLASRGVNFWLVPGNHDRGLPPIPGLAVAQGPIRVGRWLVVHEASPGPRVPTVSGHVHPVVRGADGRSPCFLVGPQHILVPAFSDDAAGVSVTSLLGYRRDVCFAIVNGAVRRVITSAPGRPRRSGPVECRTPDLPQTRAM